jgi:putative transposase
MKGDRLDIRNCPALLAHLPEETEPKIRLKLAFLVCFSRIGMDLEVLCESFGIATPTGYEWIRTWNQKGYEGLLESGSRPGRPPRLDDIDLSYLASLIRQKQGWTTQEVAELIQSTFGVQYAPAHVARMLRKRLKMYFGKPFVQDHRRPEEAEDLLAERLTETFKALKEQNIPRHAIALAICG